MLKLDGVRRSQVKELRHQARWLADRHPDVHGAVFIGRKLMPIEGTAVRPLSSRVGSPVLYEVPGPQLLALPEDVALGESPPVIACHESGDYGTMRDHYTVAFYGDREGYRRLADLALSMHDLGVRYSTLGPLAGFREWFAAGALLGYLLETAEHHNDAMPIRVIEGTVEHSGWVGPITYYAMRPSLTRAASYLLSGTLARDKPKKQNSPLAQPSSPSKKRGDLAVEIEGYYLAMNLRISRGQSKKMPTQAEIARRFGCDEGTVSKIIKPIRSRVSAATVCDRREPGARDD